MAIWRCGNFLNLGLIDYKILTRFLRFPGVMLSRQQLKNLTWPQDCSVDARTIDAHIGKLRKKLSVAGKDLPIKTIRGFGYRFDPVN
jgi:DNA-binding response OmpR family regulator